MAQDSSLRKRLLRNGFGCATSFLVLVIIAWAIDRVTTPARGSEFSPWVGLAASFFLTLGLASLAGILSGNTRSGGRRALLAGANARELPEQDGPLLVTGTPCSLQSPFHRQDSTPLQSPLTGTECVAYRYRMFYLTSSESEGYREIPVYWGQASQPFGVETRLETHPDAVIRMVKVLAVPMLHGAPERLDPALHGERSRNFIAATKFETASSVVGALSSAFTTVNDILSEDSPQYRRDWFRGGSPLDPSALILEETVLAADAVVSVLGPWSAARQAIVPHIHGLDALSTSAAQGTPENLMAQGDVLPASTLAGTITALVLLGIGGAIVWGAMKLLGPGH